MRRSRARTVLYRLAAAVVGTALVTVGGVGPASADERAVLLVPSSIKLGKADPGTSVALPVRLHVSGDTPSEGASFVFGGYRAGVELRRYGNCTYYLEPEYRGEPTSLSGAVCKLTGTLEPGKSYDIVAPDGAPVRLDVARDAQGPWRQISSVQVHPDPATHASEKEGWLKENRLLTAVEGTGAPLRLVERDTETPGPDWRPNITSFELTTTANPFDFAALGTTAAGKAGDTVTASVGVRNHGPSTMVGHDHERHFALRVAVPEGAEMVEVPQSCVPATAKWSWDTDAPTAGHPRYLCRFSALQAGAEVKFPLRMKLTRVVADATGALEVDLGGRSDTRSSNNTATLVLNPTADTDDGGPSTGGPSTGGPSTGGPSTDDDRAPTGTEPGDDGGANAGGGAGGGLPVTGANPTGLVLTAAAFLILGAVLFLASRRRSVTG